MVATFPTIDLRDDVSILSNALRNIGEGVGTILGAIESRKEKKELADLMKQLTEKSQKVIQEKTAEAQKTRGEILEQLLSRTKREPPAIAPMTSSGLPLPGLGDLSRSVSGQVTRELNRLFEGKPNLIEIYATLNRKIEEPYINSILTIVSEAMKSPLVKRNPELAMQSIGNVVGILSSGLKEQSEQNREFLGGLLSAYAGDLKNEFEQYIKMSDVKLKEKALGLDVRRQALEEQKLAEQLKSIGFERALERAKLGLEKKKLGLSEKELGLKAEALKLSQEKPAERMLNVIGSIMRSKDILPEQKTEYIRFLLKSARDLGYISQEEYDKMVQGQTPDLSGVVQYLQELDKPTFQQFYRSKTGITPSK